MRNVPIEGGRDVGPPPGWDPALSGECLTIHVLTTLEGGSPYQATAWQLDERELAALQAGGHLFFAVNGRAVPVQRLWVQEADGTLAGDLQGRREPDLPVMNAAGRRKALVAIADQLAGKLGTNTGNLAAVTTDGVIRQLAAMVDEVQPPVLRLPLLTLDDVVRGDAAVREATPGEVRDVYEAFGLERPPLTPGRPDLQPPGGLRLRAAAEPAELTQSERFVLGWLAKEPETGGLVGECKGQALDTLITRGLVRVEASGRGGDWDRAMVTDEGRKLL